MGPKISFYEGSWESGGKNQELPGKDALEVIRLELIVNGTLCGCQSLVWA